MKKGYEKRTSYIEQKDKAPVPTPSAEKMIPQTTFLRSGSTYYMVATDLSSYSIYP